MLPTPTLAALVFVPAFTLVVLADRRYQPPGMRALAVHLIAGIGLAAPAAAVLLPVVARLPGTLHPFSVLTLGQLAIAYQLLAGLWLLRAAAGAVRR
jgi:hypothetical protein